MSRASRDQQAEAAIKAAILALMGAETVERIHVGSVEDRHGEPDLSVAVFMKAGQEQITGARLLDAIGVAADALRDIDDERVPYVTFLRPEDEGPEDESAEDARPAA